MAEVLLKGIVVSGEVVLHVVGTGHRGVGVGQVDLELGEQLLLGLLEVDER